MEPRLKEAQEGKRIVLFGDAAHFVYKAYLGFVWCFNRVLIKAPCGRERLNILGAVNAINKKITVMTNTTYINAEVFCEFLHRIAKQYVSIPITLVLDNARYQKCGLVKETAKVLNIELLYLPSYSPNLNLIERVWKFTKKQCLYSKYYTTFKEFSSTIINVVEQSHTKHKKELKSLLTLNFQSFKTELMTA